MIYSTAIWVSASVELLLHRRELQQIGVVHRRESAHKMSKKYKEYKQRTISQLECKHGHYTSPLPRLSFEQCFDVPSYQIIAELGRVSRVSCSMSAVSSDHRSANKLTIDLFSFSMYLIQLSNLFFNTLLRSPLSLQHSISMLCDFLLLFFLCPSKSHHRAPHRIIKKQSQPHLRHFRPTHRERAVPARHSKWKWAVLYKKKSNAEVANSRQITMQNMRTSFDFVPRQMTDRRRRLITLCRCENWRCDGSNSLLEIFQLLPFALELSHEVKISHTTQASKKQKDVASAAKLCLEKVLKGSAQLSVNEIACLKH